MLVEWGMQGWQHTRDNFKFSNSTLCSAKAQERVGLGSHFVKGETESQSNGAFALELCQSREGIQIS